MFGREYRAMRRYLAENENTVMPTDAREIYRGTVGSVIGSRLITGFGTLHQMVFTDDHFLYAVMAHRTSRNIRHKHEFGPDASYGPFGSRMPLKDAEDPSAIGKMLDRLRMTYFCNLPFTPEISRLEAGEKTRRPIGRRAGVVYRVVGDPCRKIIIE